jgi:hypothetical protein
MGNEEGESERAMRFVNNFQVDESSVPEGMTLAEWRRANARPRKGLRARMRRIGRRGDRSGAPPGAER